MCASHHALLLHLRVTWKRKQKPVLKGTVLHTGESASRSCDGKGENDGESTEFVEMNGVVWTLVEVIVLSLTSVCRREMRGYLWVCGLRSFGFYRSPVIPQHLFRACT